MSCARKEWQRARALGLGLALAAALAPARARAQSGLPAPGDYDVIVIVLDDTGTEKTGKLAPDGTYSPLYGQETDTLQPSCDRLWELWEEGIRFDNAWVAPLCSPTRSALLTGRLPSFNGVGNVVKEGNCSDPAIFQPSVLELFLPALLDEGQALQTGGVDYATAAFGKWHLSERDCDPIERGFDLFQGDQANASGEFPCELGIGGERNHFRWRRIDCSATFGGGCTPSGKDCDASCCWAVVGDGSDPAGWSAKVVTDDALAWIGSLDATTPYVAWVAYNPPHVPQMVPPRASYGRETQAWLDVYGYEIADGPQAQGTADAAFHRHLVHDAMIEAVDRQLGRFLDPLEGLSEERRERAVVIVVGDNGSDMGQVAPATINGVDVPAGHGKRSVYQLGVRTPLVVRLPPSWPESFSQASAEGFVHAVDLWRTVAQLTGLEDATIDALVAEHLEAHDQRSDSLSFLELLHDPSGEGGRDELYTEGYLVNGTPHEPPRNHAVLGRFTGPDGLAHRYKYLRSWDGSAGRDWSCLIATGTEGFYQLDDNPLEDPDDNLLGTSDPTLLGILDALRARMDAIYALDVCPDALSADPKH